MPKTCPPYRPEFRQQMAELVRAGRNWGQLSREFSCSTQTIRNWVGQAAADGGKPRAGQQRPADSGAEKLTRLRRQVR